MNELEYSDIFKILSDENRIKIINLIKKENNICVCKLLQNLNITQPTFSYHMKLLKENNLVLCEKKGINCHYRLNQETFDLLKKFF